MFYSHRKSLKECFVENVSSNEPTIFRTFTFGVCSRHDSETRRRTNNPTFFFDEKWIAFQNRLETHDFVGCKVNLIQKQSSTTLHCHGHWSILPDSPTINQSVVTDHVIFIGFNGDVHTKKFFLDFSMNLFNHHGLTITRQTSDENRVELTRFSDGLDIIIMTKLYVTIHFGRNVRFSFSFGKLNHV